MLRPIALALTLPSLLLACGSSKSDKPVPWFEADDACPGGDVVRDGTSIACVSADGLRHGRFESRSAEGVALISGQYAAGKRTGTWTQRSAAGAVLGTFDLQNGNGRVSTWLDSGTLASTADVVGDVRHGSYVAYHPDGKTHREQGQYDTGKAIGTWVFRDAANATIREIDYKDGEVWTTRHYKDGALDRTELSEAAKLDKEKRLAEERERNYQLALKAGVLGRLEMKSGAFAALTGTADFSSGLDDKDVYGGLLGNEVGEMQGGWGYGLKGTGPGGGGTGWGTIGTGRYGKIGHGSSGGGGYGTGSGRLGRKGTPPRIRIGNASATGDLDKNIIRRYVRRKIRRIQHCYEKELLVTPKLKGRVTVSWTILPSGSVTGAKATGLNNKRVHSCVAGVVRSIKFPKPKNGGAVQVRYPFILTPGTPAPKAEAAPTAKPKPTAKPTHGSGGGAMKPRATP